MEGRILLVTDGSRSSQLAGGHAIKLALLWKTSLTGLFILDKGWRDLLGDEWIVNSGTRNSFYQWFEGGIKDHAEKVLREFRLQAERLGVPAETQIKAGHAEKIIAAAVETAPTALLVLPNPFYAKPPAEAGLKFNLNKLARLVVCPILLGPGA
jgi:nucleotide-binding universal stress UspA family protein